MAGLELGELGVVIILFQDSPFTTIISLLLQVTHNLNFGQSHNKVIVRYLQSDRESFAAKSVTEDRLRAPSTHTPFVTVRGTNRTDLRRFGAFRGEIQDVSTSEANAFWRVARTIDPNMLSSIDPSTVIADAVTVAPRAWDFVRFIFENITVQEGAILRVSDRVNYITCGDLLIKRSGQIVANGGTSLFISANSIQGEQ